MPKTILLAILSILLVSSIILQPDASFKASLQGLTVWWTIVFPGLLPFLVLYEMLLAFGMAHAIGALLQPVMQRVFKLPGEAALAIALGWFGGYPAGSEAVASLRKRQLLDQWQGQRLLAYAHMPNPLFMLVVIGAGFLHKPMAGIMIAASVWTSALWLLVLAALLNRNRHQFDPANGAQQKKNDSPHANIASNIAFAMQAGREQDGRSFGKALGDAVASSVQKLMLIGGFMIFAAVLTKLAEPILAPLMKESFPIIGPAIFESHLGAYAAAVWGSPGANAAIGCALIAGILAWSGLSGILQTGYAITGTDLKLLPFVAHRLNHSLHAFLFTLLLWQPLGWLLQKLAHSGSFPAFLAKETTGFADGTRMPAALMTMGDMPVLWPYSLFAAALLFAATWLMKALLQPLTTTRKRR